MEEKYYIAISDNERQGPYTMDQLKDVITADTMVWNKDLPSWTAAQDVPQLYKLLDIKNDTIKSSFNPPKSWLLTSLLVFFIFSFIFGAIAIYYATKVDDNYLRNANSEAELYSKKARQFVIIGVVFGLIVRPFILGQFFLFNL